VLFEKCSKYNLCGIEHPGEKRIQPNQGHHIFFRNCPLNKEMNDGLIKMRRNLLNK